MTKRKAKRKQTKVHNATNADIRRALTEYGAEILNQIPVEHCELSQPFDRAGARIRVSVEVGEEENVPDLIKLKIGRRTISIPLETTTDYQLPKAY